MPCYHPWTGYRTRSGEIVFSAVGDCEPLALPCGNCIGCRLERARQWSVRCMHEASLNDYRNEFVTLTYNDDSLPDRGNLVYRDFQLFIRRVRKHFAPLRIRYFVAGEYGEVNWRPHFHALLFNCWFDDRKYFKKSPSGHAIYTSEILDKCWDHLGHASTGAVTSDSAGYVARYCVKKVNGDLKEKHYARVDADTGEVYQLVPEFGRCSLKPGIGGLWFERYKSDVFPGDKVVVEGVPGKPPRYYDKLLKRMDADLSGGIKERRQLCAKERYLDNTDERLLVKEVVTNAAIRSLKREL